MTTLSTYLKDNKGLVLTCNKQGNTRFPTQITKVIQSNIRELVRRSLMIKANLFSISESLVI